MGTQKYDISRFSMADMAACSAALRRMSKDAESMEEAASKAVRFLYEQLSYGVGLTKPFALVRLFKTHLYRELDGELQQFACGVLGSEPGEATKCLTLLATHGDREAWCSRRLSRGHQAIPLESVEMVARIPMIANLVRQFGLEIPQVLHTDANLLADLTQRTFNVFHVPEATGSPYVPAQEHFVFREKIRSVLGFGGMLPSGNLFAVIMFSRTPITRDAALLFKPLSLSVKSALLPFEERVFAASSVPDGAEMRV